MDYCQEGCPVQIFANPPPPPSTTVQYLLPMYTYPRLYSTSHNTPPPPHLDYMFFSFFTYSYSPYFFPSLPFPNKSYPQCTPSVLQLSPFFFLMILISHCLLLFYTLHTLPSHFFLWILSPFLSSCSSPLPLFTLSFLPSQRRISSRTSLFFSYFSPFISLISAFFWLYNTQ